ncbi:hypothetical protein [Williamsia serinedens]|uniref:Integral membrane protein n=1 Tax=Williamsia serinedens TaxID=391736 RepID=A0ABT1H0C7_9NOCA|nr:hypothetical protein [Williamsia serinedens]MCP2160700.1 hypothetical protein [Williamsia serinedens]
MALSTPVAKRATRAPARPGRQRVRTLLVVAGVALVAHLALRCWTLARGDFYWDDVILIARAGSSDGLGYLFDNHDGHVMPGAFAVVGLLTALAPLSWPVAAASLVLGQAVVSLVVGRLLVLVGGVRPATVAVFVLYLASPMTVPSSVWWAAGLNSLPFVAAAAWVAGDAVLACRAVPPVSLGTLAVRSGIVAAVGMAFFEKAALIGPIALVVAVLCVRREALAGGASTVRAALSRSRVLWGALVGVTAVWAVCFVLLAHPAAGDHSLSQTWALTWRGVTRGVLPALLGGPWSWGRWNPSPPFGVVSTGVVIASTVVVAAVVTAAILLRRGAGLVVLAAVGYVVVAQALVSWNRSSTGTALELAQTLRYLPDSAVVIAIAAVLILSSPTRCALSGPVRRRAGIVGGVVTGAIAVSSVVSTVAFTDSWSDNPTGAYLRTAASSLADVRDTPMFDQALPLEVLLPVAYPDNQISRVFAGLEHRPRFGDWTDRLLVLDPGGRRADGAVTRARAFAAGSGTCARPEVTGPTAIPLDGPLIRWRWTVAVGYCATGDGRIEVRIGDSAPVTVPVRSGLHPLYVQARGSGDTVSVRPLTPGLGVHFSAGQVGEVYDPALLR